MDERLQAASEAVEQRLGITFHKKELLLEAQTHETYLEAHPDHPVPCNERLEFLGDSVLQLVVTEALFERYPDASEGRLTNYRSALVSTRALGETMYALGLDLYLFFIPPYDPGPGVEVVHPGRHLSGCFAEALFAAVYLDQGLEACRRLVERLILPRAEMLIAAFVDPKGDLQILLHARFRATPTYVIIQESGPQFDKVFRVACLVGDILLATGEARRKREAQRLAAQRALETVADWERRLPTPEPSVPALVTRDG